MKTLVIHEADLSTVNVFFQWMSLIPDLTEVHELAILLKEETADRLYLKIQIREAVEIYDIRKVILFNFCHLTAPELLIYLGQEFPLVSFEQQNR
jgi:hypothetical protein